MARLRLRREIDLGRIGPPPPRRARSWRRRGVLGLAIVLALLLIAPTALVEPSSGAGAPVTPLAAATPPLTGDSPAATGDTTPDASQVPASLPPQDLTGYQWPLAHARVTTWFAPVDGGFVVVGGRTVHDGIDLATFCGDTVRAAHAGRVLYAGRFFDWYLGYFSSPQPYFDELKARGLPSTVLPIVVVVDDGNGYRSIYVHLESASVHTGQVVRGGQALGREGRTGHATGCHLHYELIRMDGAFVPVAPALVAKWHYPAWVHERIDPLLVLDPFAAAAARPIPGIAPPQVSPSGPPFSAILAMWRLRDATVAGAAERHAWP